jgi:uncharacterized protein YndB with AHSA1/START domain
MEETRMPYAFTLTATIPASAQEIYDAWLDSEAHTEMTGGEAAMSDEVGAEVVAWGGYITGRNLELIPGERIVQSWRTAEFTDEHKDSIVTVTLEEVADGTLLTLTHSRVPDGQTSYEDGGWQVHYLEPMQDYFAARKRPNRKAKATAPKAKAKVRSKSKAKPKAKRSAAKAKPATSKPKRAQAKPKTKTKTKTKAKAKKANTKTKKKAGRKASVARRRK